LTAAATDVRHAQVGDDDIEGLARLAGGVEGIDTRLPTVGRDNHVAIGLERVAQRLEHHRVIVNEQDA